MNPLYLDVVAGGAVAQAIDACVMVASGEIDYSASPMLRDRIFSQIERSRYLVLDLSAVTFVDSTAIGVLVGAATTLCARAGGSLTVVCTQANERVLRVFEIAGVAGAIALYDSREQAIAVLAATRRAEAQALSARCAPATSQTRPSPRADVSSSAVMRAYASGGAAARRFDAVADQPRRMDELA